MLIVREIVFETKGDVFFLKKKGYICIFFLRCLKEIQKLSLYIFNKNLLYH